MIKKDFVVVGSGLTGSTIARILSDHHQDVIILERKNHIAGNIYDYRHECGAMIHEYGPHYFRCRSEKIWNFLNRFTGFYDWSATLLSKVNNSYFNWPIQQNYIEEIASNNKETFKGKPSNFEEACLAKMPRKLYELFVKGYTEKQWGVNAAGIDKELASRIRVNKVNENQLTPNYKWNALPRFGYTKMAENIIEKIPMEFEFDYLQHKEKVIANKMLIFTGPIDEFFAFKYGKLKYRGQNRCIEYFEGIDEYQPAVQVNYPNIEERRIRTIEWKHLMPAEEKIKVKGTVLTHEIPFTPDNVNQYEYPFPDKINKLLYQQYKKDADKLDNVLICGRLGEYRYYDMDQAIGRAMKLASAILKKFDIPSVEYASFKTI